MQKKVKNNYLTIFKASFEHLLTHSRHKLQRLGYNVHILLFLSMKIACLLHII